MRLACTVAALAACASAFPGVSAPESRTINIDTDGVPVRENEQNSGFIPNLHHGVFQDVRPGSGHEFQAPGKGDVRGPCPGLNAAANHNFISHTGVLDFHDTTVGLPDGIGISHEFTHILFVLGVFSAGSFVDMKWSIGGPMKSHTLGGLLAPGLGISNTHNRYEGDSSPGRGDAYLHDGDSHSLNIPNFSNFYHDAAPDGTYNLDVLRRQAVRTHRYTKQNNPYAFFGPTFVVSPIAHHFIVTMMSNFSPEHPQGQLTKETLKSFFSVKEAKDGTLSWNPGHDRIPFNWYRRPSNNLYGTAPAFADLAILIAQHPEIGEVGGNLGKPNTFVGLDFSDLTGGVFNSKDLLKGNNLACVALEGMKFVVPGAAGVLIQKASAFARLAEKIFGKQKKLLGCPELTEYNMKPFERYPGFTWQQPLQPATPY